MLLAYFLTCLLTVVLVVWRSGNALVSINKVNLRLVLGWVTVSGSIPRVVHLFRYVTCVPYLSALEVCSRQGAIQMYVYLYLYLYVYLYLR